MIPSCPSVVPSRLKWTTNLHLALASILLALANLSSAATSSSQSLLAALAADEFSPESTTSVPISGVSVWMKRLLSRDTTLPADLGRLVKPSDTLPVAPVRQWLNAQRFDRVITGMCGGSAGAAGSACDVNEVDPEYGLTPLHVATASGDEKLADWLVRNGGNPDALDGVGRRPQNLTYDNFISNSKKWARAAGRLHCDLPEVVFDEGADSDAIEHAMSEARRLVGEGEPVLLRGAFRHFAPELMNDWNVEDLVRKFAHVPVTVGAVPYAAAFDLATKSMSLGEYYDRFVRKSSDKPLYVFDKHSELSSAGYDAIANMVRIMLPVPSLITDPEDSGGVAGIHFFFGRPGSGAPFHIHADAVNAVVAGSKKWFVYTPKRTVYSRTPVQEWIDNEYTELIEADKPLECIQKAGDVVYVPLDWGHAVVNLEENTFGYALELLNKRDTFASYRSNTLPPRDEL